MDKNDIPITDDVRDQEGDYLASVENLELSHRRLLKAAENLLPLLRADLNVLEPFTEEIDVLEKAIEKANEIL